MFPHYTLSPWNSSNFQVKHIHIYDKIGSETDCTCANLYIYILDIGTVCCGTVPDFGTVPWHTVLLYPITTKCILLLLLYSLQTRTQNYCNTNQYYMYLKAEAPYSKDSTWHYSQLALKLNFCDRCANSSWVAPWGPDHFDSQSTSTFSASLFKDGVGTFSLPTQILSCCWVSINTMSLLSWICTVAFLLYPDGLGNN